MSNRLTPRPPHPGREPKPALQLKGAEPRLRPKSPTTMLASKTQLELARPPMPVPVETTPAAERDERPGIPTEAEQPTVRLAVPTVEHNEHPAIPVEVEEPTMRLATPAGPERPTTAPPTAAMPTTTPPAAPSARTASPEPSPAPIARPVPPEPAPTTAPAARPVKGKAKKAATAGRGAAAPSAGAPVGGAGAGERKIHGWALFSVLAALMLTLLLSALDQTIVGTALPRIISDLHGFDRYTWVVTAYLLTSTTVMPILGKLSDQFGRKWFLIGGTVVFLGGSALSGLSQTMNQLILFRGLQGLGAGALLALIFTLVGDIFPPRERARWQGIFAGVFGISSVVGPTAGGWITDHLSWHWVFYVNLPLGIVALFLLVFWLPSNISARTSAHTGWAAARRIDVLGALLAAGATVCLLLGLNWGGQTYPWDSTQVVGTLVASGGLFVIFFVVERFAVEPILPFSLFQNGVFAVDALLSLAIGMVFLSTVIYLPLFIQGVMGQSATSSGTVITPLTVMVVIGAVIAGQMIARLKKYQALSIIGGIVLTGGIFLLSQMTASESLVQVTIFMVIVGLGLGFFQPVLTLVAQNLLPRHQLGVGTGVITYLRATGSTLGIAILGTVASNTVTTELARRLPAQAHTLLPPQALAAATNEQVLVNKGYHDGIIHNGIQQGITHALPQAVYQATKDVPWGPNHDAIVAGIADQVKTQVTQQVTITATSLFNQIFDAVKQAEAIGIAHAFTSALLVCAVIMMLTFFLWDVPLRGGHGAPATAPGQPEKTAEPPVPVAMG